MCSDCHSTDLQKNYDAATDTFATRWSEISVGCEACHGPGSAHVAWAEAAASGGKPTGANGLSVSFASRRHAAWKIDPATGNAARSKVRDGDTEIEVCAQCHSRRGQFSNGYRPGEKLMDHYLPALLTRRPLLPGRPAARRGLQLGLVPLEPHVLEGRHLRRLPRAARRQAARGGQRRVRAVPSRVEVRHAEPPFPRGRHAGCGLRFLPHGDRRPTWSWTRGMTTASASRARICRRALGVPNACNKCHEDRSPALGGGRDPQALPEPEARLPGFRRSVRRSRPG